MRHVFAGIPLVVTVALAGCGGSTTPSAPTTSAPTGIVAVQITPPPGDAGVVGVSVPLSATVLIDGVPLADTSQAIGWSSSDTAVARIDARGVLTGVAPGQTVIAAAVKSTTGTLAVEVVPALSGDITMTWIATDCSQYNAHCASGRPILYTGVVTITQVGSRIDAAWGRLHWITGSVPFSGRIHADGSMDLSGARCSLDDIGRGTLFALTDWRMRRGSDGVYSGRARHVQENDCSGTATSRSVTDYIVELRP